MSNAELGPLPDPDTHCWDDDTSKDCWSYSADQMRSYAAAEVAKERERCAKLCEFWNATHPIRLAEEIRNSQE